MLLPVFSLMTSNGLNPALVIWFKSCPINFLDAVACENANANDFIFSSSPKAMSPMFCSIWKAKSALSPNDIIVFYASMREVRSYGEAKPYRVMFSERRSAVSALPLRKVSKLVCCFSNSNPAPAKLWNREEILPASSKDWLKSINFSDTRLIRLSVYFASPLTSSNWLAMFVKEMEAYPPILI